MSTANDFIAERLITKKWGLAIVFAAGLHRKNTELLARLVADVRKLRRNAVGIPSSDYFYGAYLIGRILSNSDTAEEGPRVEVLREVLTALQLSLPEFIDVAKAQFGNIGEIAALIVTEHTFTGTVGVPWLENQFGLLAVDASLTDEQRYFVCGTHMHLGCAGALSLIETVASNTEDTRVLLALKVLVDQVMRERNLTPDGRRDVKNLLAKLNRRLGKPGRKKEAHQLTRIRSKVLRLEYERMRKLNSD